MLGIGGIRLGAGVVIELSPADAAIAAQWLDVKTVIPGHYLYDSPAIAQLTADLSAVAPQIHVVELEVDEEWTAQLLPHPDLESPANKSSEVDRRGTVLGLTTVASSRSSALVQIACRNAREVFSAEGAPSARV